MSGGFFNRFSPWGGAAGVGINSRGALTARAEVATTQSVGLMDLGAPVAESPLRTRRLRPRQRRQGIWRGVLFAPARTK